MALSPPMRIPVPSASLLRFLRHQTESLFAIEGGVGSGAARTARHARHWEDGEAGPGLTACHRRAAMASRAARRVDDKSTAPTAAALQASMVDLHTIVPRAVRAHLAGKTPTPKPANGTHAMPARPAFFSTSPPARGRHWPDRQQQVQNKIELLQRKLEILQQEIAASASASAEGEAADSTSADASSCSSSRASHAAASATAPAASWHDRFWKWHWGSGSSSRASLQPGDLPDPATTSEFASVMFNTRRLLTAKAALEPRLRCTEVDENGEVIMVDGEFKKTELIAKYGLLPRDLRKIDSSNLPHILVRPAAILLNLLHLKVLIKADRVLLFDVYGSKTSYPQSAFLYDLQARLQHTPTSANGQLPYEFRALEAVLLSVTSELEAEFDTVREPVLRILHELEADITRDKLRMLLVLSKKVNKFEQKAKLVRDAIEELLEADDDLAAMYLTEKRHDLFRGEDDHTEVEMLLESYHKICDEVAQEAGSLVSSIRNSEEIIRAILDANRNALMLLDLKFSIGTLGLAMGTFMAGLYGMNLENFIEHTNWGFGAVGAASLTFSLVVCWYGLVKLRKVQRVKMHGISTGVGVIPGAGFGGGYSPGLLGGANGMSAGDLAAGHGMSGLAASHGPTAAAAGTSADIASGAMHAAPLDAHSQARLRRLGMTKAVLMPKRFY